MLLLIREEHNECEENSLFPLFRQLNSTGRAVFKENVRLHEALAYHLKESEELQKIKKQLEEDKALLLQEKVPGLVSNFISGSPRKKPLKSKPG